MLEVGVTGSVGVGDARVGMEYGVRNVSVGVGAGTSVGTGCPLTVLAMHWYIRESARAWYNQIDVIIN